MKIDDNFFGVVKEAINEEINGISADSISRICASIAKVAGGEQVYISKSHNKMLSVRNARIKEERISGIPLKRLATKHRLSLPHIYKIVK